MNPVLAALRDADHVSVSAVKTYLMCPDKYRHRYIEGTEPSHRSAGLVIGHCVHEALAEFYRNLDISQEHLLDVLRDAWTRSLKHNPPAKVTDQDMDVGLSLVRVFHEQAPHPLEVLAVEEPFAVPVVHPETGVHSDSLLVGAVDAIVVDQDGKVVLVESKTAARRWAPVQLAHDMQPTLYQMAVRQMGLAEFPTLRLDFLLKLKTPAFETVEVFRTAEQEKEASRVLWEVLRAIEACIFYPVRSWACSDCEFAHQCR